MLITSDCSIEYEREKDKIVSFKLIYGDKELELPIKYLNTIYGLVKDVAEIVHKEQGLTNEWNEEIIKDFNK